MEVNLIDPQTTLICLIPENSKSEKDWIPLTLVQSVTKIDRRYRATIEIIGTATTECNLLSTLVGEDRQHILYPDYIKDISLGLIVVGMRAKIMWNCTIEEHSTIIKENEALERVLLSY